jgi:uncharacterized protein (TIGR03435 family)
VYDLTTAKSGLRIPKPTDGDCNDSSAVPSQSVKGRPPGPCGYATVAFDPVTGLSVVGRQVSMADLIQVLQTIIQRPILDRTGFLEVQCRSAICLR